VRTTLFYATLIVVVGAAILGVLRLGSSLPPVQARPAVVGQRVAPAQDHLAHDGMLAGLKANLDTPLSHLFIQLLVIVVAARAMGRFATRVGQPAVVGEMVAGLLLGPSLFGWLWPDAFTFVFPATSLATLRLLSQLGVCLFMFVVGMELNVAHVRDKAHAAVVVSHASIILPYLLGVLLAYTLYSQLAAPGATFTGFALFMGISMSITAFPVLARILQDRGLSRTPLGSTAITCAAVDDVTAWSLLAFVVAVARATSPWGAALDLLLVVIFIVLMIAVIRRALPRWLGYRALTQEEPTRATLAIIFCLVVAAALTTEVIGIHALFGAFLAGAIMPQVPAFRRMVGVRVEHFSAVLLLPLFFAFTGLRTEVGLLGDLQGWLLCLAIIGVATLGKLGGSAVAARVTGMEWREALQLGALMNTRGLMELIALNIGYDIGILSPRIFTMLVLMALATTAMTGPLLTVFGAREAVGREQVQPSRA
jgi:Kef-type K+ transport system membrane component KefB